jgi:hypothetical protein
MGMGNPLTGQGNMSNRMVPMSQPGRPLAPAMASLPTDPARGAGNPSAKTVPRGAQEVRLAGMLTPPLDGGPVDRGASFQPSQPAQVAPQAELAAAPAIAQAPRPFLQRQPPGETVFRVTMRGRMADGAEYASVYDAVMPLGAQPLDLSFVPLA